MTTTVMIATQGNKEVAIQTPNGRMVLPPGHWVTLGVHGDQVLTIQETGPFVTASPGARFEELASAFDAEPPGE